MGEGIDPLGLQEEEAEASQDRGAGVIRRADGTISVVAIDGVEPMELHEFFMETWNILGRQLGAVIEGVLVHSDGTGGDDGETDGDDRA